MMANVLGWIYDQAKRVFKIAGRVFSRQLETADRDIYIERKLDFTSTLTKSLFDGNINIQQWTLNFRQELKTLYINEYLSARGGVNAMTQADWGRLGGMLKRQYAYMNNFAREIANGQLTEKQIAARMQLYFNSATQAYERGKSVAAGIPQMPQYPGDGRTQCRTNCKCTWEYVETESAWECYWRLHEAEHCPDCVQNSITWNPLVIAK
jgi:hypothetical protein